MSQTISYTYDAAPVSGQPGVLVRSTDGAFIPCNLGNMDYLAFLAWVAEGNQAPEGWTGPTKP